MLDLGQEVFYAQADSGVSKGLICGHTVNEQGHEVYTIKDGKKYIVIFCTMCFDNEEAAAKEYERITALNDKIKAIQKEANDKINSLLEEIHGKPQFEHLTLAAEKE